MNSFSSLVSWTNFHVFNTWLEQHVSWSTKLILDLPITSKVHFAKGLTNYIKYDHNTLHSHSPSGRKVSVELSNIDDRSHLVSCHLCFLHLYIPTSKALAHHIQRSFYISVSSHIFPTRKDPTFIGSLSTLHPYVCIKSPLLQSTWIFLSLTLLSYRRLFCY